MTVEAVQMFYRRPFPTLPDHWGVGEQHGYRQGWQDAMQHVRDAAESAATVSQDPEE